MAKCDEGYRCEVCGEDVTSIVDSDLYLRFVIGELDPEVLHTNSERHIRCNPVLAQFIEHDTFERGYVEGDFSRESLDPSFVSSEPNWFHEATHGYWRSRRPKGIAT